MRNLARNPKLPARHPPKNCVLNPTRTQKYLLNFAHVKILQRFLNDTLQWCFRNVGVKHKIQIGKQKRVFHLLVIEPVNS